MAYSITAEFFSTIEASIQVADMKSKNHCHDSLTKCIPRYRTYRDARVLLCDPPIEIWRDPCSVVQSPVCQV